MNTFAANNSIEYMLFRGSRQSSMTDGCQTFWTSENYFTEQFFRERVFSELDKSNRR